MNQSGGNQVRAHHPDYGIAVIVTVLLCVGLVLMYSISPILSYAVSAKTPSDYYFMNQLKYVALGVAFWVGATAFPYSKWRTWGPRLLILSVIMLAALMIPHLSKNENGATRWLALGPLSVQPAEILKLALLIYLAAWFEKHRDKLKSLKEGVWPFVAMIALAAFAVAVLQKDFGSAAVIVLACVGTYFAAGLPWRYLWGLVGVVGGAGVAAIAAFPHRMERITTFFHMQCGNLVALATSPDYHSCQALIAAGSGGFFGLGLGHSIQVYGYLPEAANDSIFAIIAEEFGLIGSLFVVALFGLLVWRGIQVARSAPDMFGRLVAAGISIWMFSQALINIAAMLALIPLTGIPLPFISYGGTSLVISLFGMGILLNISKYTVREANDANSRQRRGDSRAYLANPGNMRRVKIAR